MQHKKTNTAIFIFSLLFLAVFCIGISSTARADDYLLQVEIADPADVCPNILGVQPSIPNGMQFDGSGNCYTPAPPPPVVMDLCTNISGIQSTLPPGYYRTSGGKCYLQPTLPAPPVDVCTNMDAVQVEVPDGYYLDTSGSCNKTPEEKDVCPNINGPQATIPDGMVLKNDICYTPTTNIVTSPPDSSTSSPYSTGVRNNVSSFLQPITQNIVNAVPEKTREWLRELPEQVAQAVPFYIFIITAIVALIPILQAVREALFVRQLRVLLSRERDVADQKDNFISLASHYLRTPLTLMKSSLDTIVSLQELPEESVQPLITQLGVLDLSISQVLEDVEKNSALKDIKHPANSAKATSVWKSGWFWGPIVTSAVLSAVANFLLVVVGDKNLNSSLSFFQSLVAAIAFFILYLGVRNLHLQRKLHEENDILIAHERTIDEARNSFISQATVTLRDGLEPIEESRDSIDAAPSAKYFTEGFGRMTSILERFLLLSHVQAAAGRTLEVFDLREAIDQLLVTYNEPISAKRITVANSTSAVFIKQDRLLFNFVLGSVLDNAIKFNNEGGSIEIKAEPNKKMLHITVNDNGIGIDNEKLDQLFKPFSRTTSAVEFNYEGLGFSLFLDKIIMDYTGGSISAESTVSGGTQLRVTTPVTVQ